MSTPNDLAEDVSLVVDVAQCASRKSALKRLISETVIDQISVDSLENMTSLPREAQDESALRIADAAEAAGRPGLAIMWRLTTISMMPAIGWPKHQDYVRHAINFISLKRTMSAQVARDRLRAWYRAGHDEVRECGGDLFTAAASYQSRVGDDMTCGPSIPLAMLLANRWDVAYGTALHATKRMLEAVDRTVPEVLQEAPENSRVEWRKTAKKFATALMDIRQGWSGELSLAWRMLLCEIGAPRTFSFVVPQLKWMLDDAAERGEALKAAQDRLNVWIEAAVGKHVDSDVSIFCRAFDKTKNGDKESSSKWGSPQIESDEADASTPHVVVLPESGANQKNLSYDWKRLINKRIALVVVKDVAAITDTLRAEYPHAWREVGMLVKDLREDKPAWVRPTILLGEPGGGKSRLVRRLAELLSIYVNRFDASSAMDGMFAGTTKGWSTAQPSVPSNAILAARHANPLVLIDEIEKASESTHNGNFWNTITPLLERETSSRYRDKGIDCELDLSHVSYVATANAVERLPAPLRDRFRIIKIPSPSMRHLPALAANVLRDFAREDEERAHEPPLAADELAIIGRAWERERFSMRKLQRLISATLEARDACAMRH